MADPFSTIRRIYAALGRELTGAAEERMRAFLAAHPGDGDGGAARYRFADTGLDADGPARAITALPGALRGGLRARPVIRRFRCGQREPVAGRIGDSGKKRGRNRRLAASSVSASCSAFGYCPTRGLATRARIIVSRLPDMAASTASRS